MICLWALKVTLVSTQQGNLLVSDYPTGLSSSPEIVRRISLPFAFFLNHTCRMVSPIYYYTLTRLRQLMNEKYYQWYFLKGFFCHLIKGSSRVSQEDQPILHRDVQRLEDLCINHVGHRLPGHQNPISSLGTLPHAVCDKILIHLMKNKSLSPKAMQAFISW